MSDHPSHPAETDQAAAGRAFEAAQISPWSGNEKIAHILWKLFGSVLFRFSSHTRHPYRRAIPRLFGATIGQRTTARRTFDDP